MSTPGNNHWRLPLVAERFHLDTCRFNFLLRATGIARVSVDAAFLPPVCVFFFPLKLFIQKPKSIV